MSIKARLRNVAQEAPAPSRPPVHTSVPLSWQWADGRPPYACMVMPDGEVYAFAVGDCGEVTVGSPEEMMRGIRYTAFPDYTALPGDRLPDGWRMVEVWPGPAVAGGAGWG